MTREILMMTLAEVASISIRANINIDTTKLAIKNINYETATTNPAGNPLSTVEKCACPEGYTGTLFSTLGNFAQTVHFHFLPSILIRFI